MALLAQKEGFLPFIVPPRTGYEASVVKGIEVTGRCPPTRYRPLSSRGRRNLAFSPPGSGRRLVEKEEGVDFSDIKGQAQAKRALEIAAAGGHNVLMVGPPGSGKTMLARRMPDHTAAPRLRGGHRDDQNPQHSRAPERRKYLVTEKPFRAPTIPFRTRASSGEAPPPPGEISLAHNGVLFLDEFPEFKRNILDALRQPLESGNVVISRVSHAVTFPARFMLIAAMNPCPCGYYGDAEGPASARAPRSTATEQGFRDLSSTGSTYRSACRRNHEGAVPRYGGRVFSRDPGKGDGRPGQADGEIQGKPSPPTGRWPRGW